MKTFKRINRMMIKSFLLMITIIAIANIGHAKDNEDDELSGSDLWAQNCGRCHNYRGPQEFNDAQWSIIVSHMRVIGGIPGNQARAITRFLQNSNNPPLEPMAISTTEVAPEMKEPELMVEVGKANIEEGRFLFEKNCASCHGKSGKGDGPAAVSMRPKPRNLSDRKYMSDLSDEYLYKIISYGGTSVGKSALMPAWETVLSEDDIVNLIGYLRTLSGE